MRAARSGLALSKAPEKQIFFFGPETFKEKEIVA